jgi:hypothetical protein
MLEPGQASILILGLLLPMSICLKNIMLGVLKVFVFVCYADGEEMYMEIIGILPFVYFNKKAARCIGCVHYRLSGALDMGYLDTASADTERLLVGLYFSRPWCRGMDPRDGIGFAWSSF